MSIAKIPLDESMKLEFGVSITGASGLPSSRLVIEGKDFAVSFPCEHANGKVEATINHLKNVLSAGEYPVKLEIVIENKIFTAFQDTIIFEAATEVTPKTSASVKEAIKIENVSLISHETIDQKMIIAEGVAKLLKYQVQDSESAQSIIENAIMNTHKLSKTKGKVLQEMLELARNEGIELK